MDDKSKSIRERARRLAVAKGIALGEAQNLVIEADQREAARAAGAVGPRRIRVNLADAIRIDHAMQRRRGLK